jgi:hypothetical protein
MDGAAMIRFHDSGASRLIEKFSLFRLATVADGTQA